MIAKHIRNVWAVQLSANQICLQFATDDNLVLSTMVASDLSISDLCISEKNLILTNGRTIVTYKLTKDVPNDQDDNKQKYNAKILNSFGSDSLETYIYDQSIIVLTQSNIKILSLSGVLLQEIHFSDAEGMILCYCACMNDYVFSRIFCKIPFGLFHFNSHDRICTPSCVFQKGCDKS